MRSFGTLLKHELKLNIRNMNMVIFAVILPLVVLIILGFVYGAKPAAEGASYTFLEQSIGALCTISICASGLMGLPLVVSEYRERKILKRFQVTPVSPAKLLAVEFTIYVLYFPMLIFSGATLPLEVMPGAMQKIVSVFPLTQGIQLMKAAFLGLRTGGLWLPVAVMGAVTVICMGVAVKCFKWE